MNCAVEVIVVSDANIFIDLCDSGVIEAFFEMPWKVHTTDMVYAEVLKPEHREKLKRHSTKLVIKEYNPVEFQKLVQFQIEMRKTCNLSIQDCSLLTYCMDTDYTLLTGDRTLRTKATERKVNVRGVLYIFDQMLSIGQISKEEAVSCLERLRSSNTRLPSKEIDTRLTEWKKKSGK